MYRKLFFIGIGGIGMSALARYYHRQGVEIYGYDRTPSPLTQRLEREGMHIHYEDDPGLIPEGINMVVYTPAVPKTHAQLNYFYQHDYPVKKRAEVLGMISREHKAIAVAGTHGKTTTSSLLTHVLRECGVDATAFLGGIANNFETNYVHGEGDWVVAEADEYDRSFLHLQPDISILTSIDPDHLDIYGDESQMHETFLQFIGNLVPDGLLVMRHGLDITLPEAFTERMTVHTFGIAEGADYRIHHERVEGGYATFDLTTPHHGTWEGVQLAMPGQHNAFNAVAALAVALQLECTEQDIRNALLSFKGIGRRFEYVYRSDERVYIDDYAHHPTELRAAIHAARAMHHGKRVTGVFQPHLFSRTRDFAEGFSEALSELDEVILIPIYPAREEPIPGVTSQLLLDGISHDRKRLLPKAEVVDTLREERDTIEILMTLGAGDIDRLVPELKGVMES